MATVSNIATSDGEVIRIETDCPLIGVTALNSFVDTVTGETTETYFEKYFRISFDGGNTWDVEWTELTEANLSVVNVDSKKSIVVEYRYKRVGGGDDLSVSSVQLNGDCVDFLYPIFETTEMSNWVSPDELDVLNWALNVLEKMLSNKYTAFYLSRSEDLTSYFFTVTTFFAMYVIYCRRINDVLSYADIAKEFLNQLGIYISNDSTLEEISEIISDYVVEFGKRGTQRVFGESNEIQRLIDYEEGDEYIKCQIKRGEVGWCLGHSSPMYNGTEGIEQAVKGYEQSENVVDISKYPNNNNDGIEGNFIVVSQKEGGVGYTTNDLPFFIPIDSSLDYEVSVKIIGLAFYSNDWGVNYGVRAFTENNINSEVQLRNSIDGAAINTFLSNFTVQKFGQEYWIRGILRKSGTDINSNDKLSMGFGNNLILENGIKYVVPFILTNEDTSFLQIRALHIKPLYLPNKTSRGILGTRNLFYWWILNESNQSEEEVKEVIEKELMNYNSLHIYKFLE